MKPGNCRRRCWSGLRNGSNVKEEVADVAVLHDVGFAFDAQFPRLFDGLLGFVLFKILNGVDFDTNEAAFEVAVNNARRLRSGGADGNRMNRMLSPYFQHSVPKRKYRRRRGDPAAYDLRTTMNDVSNIRYKMGILESDLKGIESALNSIEIELRRINSTLDSLDTRFSTVEEDVTDLKVDMNIKKFERAFKK